MVRGSLEKFWNVRGVMLPVAIESQSRREALLLGVTHAGPKRRSFALRLRVAQDFSPGAPGEFTRGICRAVVHHNDRGQKFADLPNDALDRGSFVEAGNHGGTLSGPIHLQCSGVSSGERCVSRIKWTRGSGRSVTSATNGRVLAPKPQRNHTGLMKTIAILGASADRQKFGNKAVRAFLQQGYTVYPVNPKEAEIEGLTCYPSIGDVPERPHTVSVYLPPPVLLKVLPAIAAKGCDELWLNPGTESDEVLAEAGRLGVSVVQACSIVGVGVSPATL